MHEVKQSCKCNPVLSLISREHESSKLNWNAVQSRHFMLHRLNHYTSLYQKNLYSHYGCVNAIDFSLDGNYLVSGGDDRRVLMWHISSALAGQSKPVPMQGEHSSNIFCLSFDSVTEKIYSAGNDDQVLVHDINTGKAVDVFLHEEAVYGLSVNPLQSNTFASAGEDGQVLIHDIKAPSDADPLCVAKCSSPFHSVQFHPMDPHFLITANSKKGIAMWDVRRPKEPVLRYGVIQNPYSWSTMCARFNRTGSQFIVLRRRLFPLLFRTEDPRPICKFDANHYYNSCTMKSCCFAGDKDEYVLSGSDDFNLYMWKIPSTLSDEKITKVNKAHMILRGHRSIVNQVRYDYQNYLIASSGVEKIIKLWSPLNIPGSYGFDSARHAMSRKFYTQEEYLSLFIENGQGMSHDYSQGSTEEDPKMMAFFDSLVQREVEGWTSDSDCSDSLYEGFTVTDSDEEDETGLHHFPSGDSEKDYAPCLNAQDEGNHQVQQGTSEWILQLISKKRNEIRKLLRWKKAKELRKTSFIGPRQMSKNSESWRRFQRRLSRRRRRRLHRRLGPYTVLILNSQNYHSSSESSEDPVLTGDSRDTSLSSTTGSTDSESEGNHKGGARKPLEATKRLNLSVLSDCDSENSTLDRTHQFESFRETAKIFQLLYSSVDCVSSAADSAASGRLIATSAESVDRETVGLNGYMSASQNRPPSGSATPTSSSCQVSPAKGHLNSAAREKLNKCVGAKDAALTDDAKSAPVQSSQCHLSATSDDDFEQDVRHPIINGNTKDIPVPAAPSSEQSCEISFKRRLPKARNYRSKNLDL